MVGYIGTPRRREGVRKDLQLLKELEEQKFGSNSQAHQLLTERINYEVASLCRTKEPGRKIPWSSVLVSVIFWGLLGYLTWWFNKDGFVWYSLFSGGAAAVMFIATLGMLFGSESNEDQAEE